MGCSTYPSGIADSRFSLSGWEGEPLVRTVYGYVEGIPAEKDTFIWRAIPFAKPPVGDLRWRAPVDPDPWVGRYKMYGFASQATQHDALFGGVSGSEDCLYLNIWRPQTKETGLPVYVFIHGGGNSIGSAVMAPSYLGHNLAALSNMVFVSIQYRLGPFGWLSHPALREGISPADDSGNYGTLDIIQSLKWIRENIRAFGGDPEKVIVTGESAGGMNVLSLMVSPLAKGLFSCAMSESGATFSGEVVDSEKTVDKMLLRLLQKDGRAKSEDEAAELVKGMYLPEIRNYLKGKSEREILESIPRGLAGMIDIPFILKDGYVIPAEGYDVFKTGNFNKVPLIVGTNRDELKLFLHLANELSWENPEYQAIGKYGSLLWKADGADNIAAAIAGVPGSPPVYAYFFCWGSPDERGVSPLPGDYGKILGAFHGLDIPFFTGSDSLFGPFFLGNLFNDGNRKPRKALSDIMMRYVSHFVRTGNPNPQDASLPEWDAWSNEQGAPKCIIFDVDGEGPNIRMETNVVTRESVFSLIEKELEDPLKTKIKERLKDGFF
ncbi:MAG: carboxylesterase family protein [Spirochaetales bacterium]|nr:carboxylesterase family protein [Spirochaetales bacterium]